MQKPPRSYSKQRRAESEAATRRRITEVTVELHGSVGPAHTTIAEIARRAGVQRLTVYNHFPDLRSLFAACTAHWFGLHPPPDPSAWQDIRDIGQRASKALAALYAYYAENEAMIANWLRDAQLIPALSDFAATGYYGYLDHLADETLPPGDANAAARAVLHVAIQFETWRTLTMRRGLSIEQAATTMAAAIEALASPE